MMDRALDAVVRRVKKLDRAHDVPYLAGYSLDGKTIYIDRHMPRALSGISLFVVHKLKPRDAAVGMLVILFIDFTATAGAGRGS